jgi:hypothetical protein
MRGCIDSPRFSARDLPAKLGTQRFQWDRNVTTVEVLEERCPMGRGCNFASMPYYDAPQCPMLKVVPLTQ